MYKMCKTEQSALRQRELEHGLMLAMLSRPYEDISISDLCDQLQVPRKSFYRYFSSKDGAFHALLDHALQDCSWFLDPHESSLEMFEQYFAFWLQKKPLLDALQRSGLSGKLVERTIATALEDQSFASHLNRLFPEHDQAYVVLFIISGLMSVVIQWHHSGCRQSPRQMAKTASRLLTEPLFPIASL